MEKLCGAGNPPQISKGNNLGRPFGGGDVVGGCMGPTRSNSGGANEAMVVGPTHRDGYNHHLLLSSPLNSGAQNPANKSQPLGIFYTHSTDPYKSSGEMVPFFTSAQWKELERQAMIYKYMISSLAVPSHLLYPPISSMYNNVGYTKNGGALEPGRCKRTDGKKWRCSRDVAPHQKYCERHLHRGRPRSRKPVELNSSNIINGDPSLKKQRLDKNPRALLSIDEEIDPDSLLTSPCDRKINGDIGLIMENNAFSIKGSSICIPKGPLSQDYCYTEQKDLNQVDHQMLTHSDFPFDLVGSWWIDNLNVHKYPSLSVESEDLSPWLNLSMGMASGLALDQEIGYPDTTRDCVEFYDEGARCSGSFCYSELFGLGGPLAEALGPSPTSPHDSINGPGPNVSSPYTGGYSEDVVAL